GCKRHSARSRAVLSGPGRAAAPSVLGADDLRGQSLYVFLVLADCHSRHGAGRIDLRHQSGRRRPASFSDSRGARMTGNHADSVLSIEGLKVDIDTPGGVLHAVRDITFD